MAEVVSSNTVGYSKINLSNGYTCIAPAFFTVGQDTTELSAVEIVDGIDGDNLSLLNSTGNTVACYYWFNAFDDPDTGDSFAAMWAEDSLAETEATGVTLNPDQAFLFYSSANAATLTVDAP